MSGFGERLAKAKAAVRPFEDVVVSLDADVSVRRAALLAELEQARKVAANDDRLAVVDAATGELEQQLEELDAETGNALVTLRIYRLPGRRWAEVTSRSPVRLDAPIDLKYGYNMDRATFLAAREGGVLLDDGEEVTLSVVKAAPGVEPVDEWDDLFNTISGFEVSLIADAVFRLNEWEPRNRVDALKKGLALHPA